VSALSKEQFDAVVLAAHEYAEEGWAVLPVTFVLKDGEPGKYVKRPLTKWRNGDAGQRATMDHDVIEQWAREFRARWHAVGVATGAASGGMFVVDSDDYKDGAATLAALPGPRVSTLTARTASGGYHLWFRDETGLNLPGTTSALGPGIDTRGEGNIAVAPPSVNPHTGKGYVWANEDVPVAPLPPEVVAALTADRSPAGGPTWRPNDRKRVGKPPRDFAADVLRACLEDFAAAEDGTWNDTLNIQAYNLARYFPGGYLDQDDTRDVLLTAAVARGIPADEARDTINSGFQGSLKDPARAWTLVEDAVASPGASPEDQEERHYQRLHAEHRAKVRFQADLTEARHGQHSQSRLVDGAAFFLDLPEQAPVLWGDGSDVLWMGGEPMMIAGDDGTGKSTIDHQLIACRLGLRDSLLGYSVAPATGRVVYLAMDRPQQARRAGARLFPAVLEGDRFRARLHDQLAVWSGPLPVDVLRSPEVLADWLFVTFGDDISEVHADSLKDIHAGLSKDEIGSGINSAIQEVVARGVNWVTLHHQRKASGENKAPDKLSDVFGSRWLSAGHGSVLMLVKGGESDKDYIELKQVKEPDNRIRPLLLKHDRANGRTSVVEAELTVEQALGLAGQVGASALELAAAAYGKAARDVSPAEKKKVERSLAAMVARDEVRKVNAASGGAGGSKSARFFLVDGPTGG